VAKWNSFEIGYTLHCYHGLAKCFYFILFFSYRFFSLHFLFVSPLFPSKKNQLQLEAQFSSFLLALFGCLIELSVHF